MKGALSFVGAPALLASLGGSAAIFDSLAVEGGEELGKSVENGRQGGQT